VTPYSTVQSWDNNAGRSKATQTIIKDLVDGNDRFVTGQLNLPFDEIYAIAVCVLAGLCAVAARCTIVAECRPHGDQGRS